MTPRPTAPSPSAAPPSGRRRSTAAALAAALAVGTLASCATGGAPDRERATARVVAAGTAPTSASTAPLAGDGTARVLAVSLDGFNVAALDRLGRDRTPVLHRLLREGAATTHARTERELTDTLPNHTGMLTGLRVDADRGGHGVTWNVERPGTTVQEAAGRPVGSVLSAAHDAGLTTALFAGKAKFRLFDDSWPGAVDTFVLDERPRSLVARAAADLAETDRDLTFVHVALPDLVGHAEGFMGPAYLDAVVRTDRLVGRLLAALAADPEDAAEVRVVLTADHGGRGPGHSDPTRFVDYRVPFLVWGPGVAAGDLYALNPDYRDPGRSRPSYDGAQPVRNGDLANVALDLLGLPALAGSLLDAEQDLDWE